LVLWCQCLTSLFKIQIDNTKVRYSIALYIDVFGFLKSRYRRGQSLIKSTIFRNMVSVSQPLAPSTNHLSNQVAPPQIILSKISNLWGYSPAGNDDLQTPRTSGWEWEQ
jgi:hypothetical protein